MNDENRLQKCALYTFENTMGQMEWLVPQHIVLIKPGSQGGTVIFTLNRDKAQHAYHLNASVSEVARSLGEISCEQTEEEEKASDQQTN